MNYEQLKSILSRSNKTVTITGSIISLAGGIGLVCVLKPETKTGTLVFLGVLLAIGLLMLIIGIKNLAQVSSGKLPLLNAIKQKQKDYLVWIYVNETRHEVDGIKAGTTSLVIMHDKYGKASQIAVPKNTSAQELVNYLASEFPNAYLGYADDTRETVSKLLNKKL